MSPVNVTSIGSYIREQREQARISLRQLAQNAGISNPYLSQIERGLRRPSADILQQIAKGLRISAEALYVQAGFLEDRPPGSMVREAVLTDPELTQRQRQMLLEIYDSFRRETAAALAAQAETEADDADSPDVAALTWPEDVGEEALAREDEEDDEAQAAAEHISTEHISTGPTSTGPASGAQAGTVAQDAESADPGQPMARTPQSNE